MATDDLWQSEPTVIRPTPGGRRGARARETTVLATALSGSGDAEPRDGERRHGDAGEEAEGGLDYRSSGMPLVVSAARPILNLLDRLNAGGEAPDPAQLRMAAIEEMRAYERKLAQGSVDVEQARIAHYVLCATIDDVVLATPWGAASDWGMNSVVSTFHRDVQGGERVYDLLDRLHRDPGRNRDVLMLIYFALSLGFRGRLRVSSRGALELAQLRDGLYRTLRGTLGEVERELSPNWRGVAARGRGRDLRRFAPFLLGFLVILASLGYVTLLSALNARSDEAIKLIAALPPRGDPSIEVETPTEPPPVQDDVLEDFLVFLQPEIERGVLTTTRNGDEVLVRFRGTGSFAPGNATVSPSFEALVERVSRAIEEARFDVLVTGHTDDRPIGTVTYPSNWHLSQARARAVARIASRFVSADRLRYEGRGETEPIDTNDTPEGREANRRIEMEVRYTPDSDPNVAIQSPDLTGSPSEGAAQ